MKRYLNTCAVLMFVVALPVTGIAQGRHDEKPHGMAKSTLAAPNRDRVGPTGGRHDEGGTTHGAKKTPASNTKPKNNMK